MQTYTLSPAQAKDVQRRFDAPLRKLKDRMPGGKFWSALAAGFRACRRHPGKESGCYFILMAASFFLGIRLTSLLVHMITGKRAQNFYLPATDIPERLYHWYPAEKAEIIRAKGLLCKYPDYPVYLTDDPDFPLHNVYFCWKVQQEGREITFRRVRVAPEPLSRQCRLYWSNYPHELAVCRVPPECLDFSDDEHRRKKHD